jgi:hypothetical protein
MKADKLKLKQALEWASQRLKDYPHLGHLKVAEEAAVKFDLGPLDEEWLISLLPKSSHSG